MFPPSPAQVSYRLPKNLSTYRFLVTAIFAIVAVLLCLHFTFIIRLPLSSSPCKIPALDAKRVRSIVSGNKELVYFPEPDIMIMSMAKSGTTTLFYWLYSGITDRPRWTPSCNTYVQDTRSSCWGRHAMAVYKLSAKQRQRVLTSPSTLRVAVQRNPFDRLVSAFKSKFSCEHARFGTDVSAQPRIVNVLRSRARLSPPSSNASRSGCMTISEYAHALDRCRTQVKDLRKLDVHIRPQQYFFDDIHYQLVFDVVDLSNISLLAPIIARLPFPHRVNGTIAARHASTDDNLIIPERAAVQLHEFARLSVTGQIRHGNIPQSSNT